MTVYVVSWDQGDCIEVFDDKEVALDFVDNEGLSNYMVYCASLRSR